MQSSEAYVELASGSLEDLHIINMTSTSSVQVMSTPSEKGNPLFDHRVLQPSTVHIEGYVTATGYSGLAKAYDAQTVGKIDKALCSVYTKEGNQFTDMLVVKITSTASSQFLNAVRVSLDMQEYLESD